MANARMYKGSEEDFLSDIGKLRRGDIIGAVGHPGKGVSVYKNLSLCGIRYKAFVGMC